jgi:hypothetical protein
VSRHRCPPPWSRPSRTCRTDSGSPSTSRVARRGGGASGMWGTGCSAVTGASLPISALGWWIGSPGSNPPPDRQGQRAAQGARRGRPGPRQRHPVSVGASGRCASPPWRSCATGGLPDVSPAGALTCCVGVDLDLRLSQRHVICRRAPNLVREVGQRAPVPAFTRRALQIEGNLANLPAQVFHLVTSGEDFQVVFRPSAHLLSRCFCRRNTCGGDSFGNPSLHRCDVVPSRVLHADQRNRPHSGRRKRIPAPTTNQPTLMPSKNRPAPRTRWQTLPPPAAPAAYPRVDCQRAAGKPS